MNPLPPHECESSFHDIMILCYKCYLAAVLIYDNGADGGVTTLTKRVYIGSTSANKIDDQNNVKMAGPAVANRLMVFEEKSQSFISRYQELVDKAIGGQKRTSLNITSDDAFEEKNG